MFDFPNGSCDTHVHFYDRRWQAAASAVLRPPDASVDEYRQIQKALGLTRVVVVQPTTYGLDNGLQLVAMKALGSQARGVMVVDEGASTAELERMSALGVRGARFHMLPGGAVPWSQLATVAARVGELGWHIQLQLDGRELADRLDTLLALPGNLVIDHVGRFMPPVSTGHRSFRALRTLVEAGRCWVKLSAPYESSIENPPDYPDVAVLAGALVAQAPERMLWASNWPHPGHDDKPQPESLAALGLEWAGDEGTMNRILVDNPAELYGF